LFLNNKKNKKQKKIASIMNNHLENIRIENKLKLFILYALLLSKKPLRENLIFYIKYIKQNKAILFQ
jgi:hypothetical protein